MTKNLYLLDTNVFREMGPKGNANVRAWLATIKDDQVRVSPVVYGEMRKGCERERRKRVERGHDTTKVDAALVALDQFERDYADRQVPITFAIQREVAKLLGAKGKNEQDMILVATANEHGLVLVTRNEKDFEGRGVRVLNPFKREPVIKTMA